MTVEFDDDGNTAATSSEMRKLKLDGEWRTTPWGGRFRNYARIGELWLPTEGEAYWNLPEGRYVYWRGSVLTAELINPRFKR